MCYIQIIDTVTYSSQDIKNIEDDLMKTVFTDIKEDLKEAASNKKSLEEVRGVGTVPRNIWRARCSELKHANKECPLLISRDLSPVGVLR